MFWFEGYLLAFLKQHGSVEKSMEICVLGNYFKTCLCGSIGPGVLKKLITEELWPMRTRQFCRWKAEGCSAIDNDVRKAPHLTLKYGPYPVYWHHTGEVPVGRPRESPPVWCRCHEDLLSPKCCGVWKEPAEKCQKTKFHHNFAYWICRL